MTKPYSVQVADAEVPAADELPSPHFLRLLAAYANASNDEYDDALAALCGYVAGVEGRLLTAPYEQSVKLILRTRADEAKKVKAAIAKRVEALLMCGVYGGVEPFLDDVLEAIHAD